MVGSGTFGILLWVLGPLSTFLGGVLIVYWLVKEIREGAYRPKYGDADLIQALEGQVPEDAIAQERTELAGILDQERERLRREEGK